MATRTMPSKAEQIKDLRERIDNVENELAAAPPFRRWTPWYEDRVKAVESLKRGLARLESE